MDPKFVNTSHVLDKVRTLKSRRKATKQAQKNYIDEITIIQEKMTNLRSNPNSFYRMRSERFRTRTQYLAYLEQQENRLNARIIDFDNQISGYNNRIINAQFFAPFDDINLNDD